MISYAILIVQFLCLSFWIGGSIVVLMIVGPEVFRRDTASSGPEVIMTRILARFNAVFLVTAFLLAATLYLQLALLSDALSIKLRIALSLVMLAILFGTYVRFSLAPRMKSLRFEEKQSAEESNPGRLQAFRKLHGRSLGIFVVNLFLGVAAVITLILPIR